jgi:hypothetical protein
MVMTAACAKTIIRSSNLLQSKGEGGAIAGAGFSHNESMEFYSNLSADFHN